MSKAYYVTHELKILPEYFKAVRDYTKNFEIRKCDREYQVGDILLLREWDGNKYTGEKVKRIIKYIYKGDGSYGLAEGYCILGITEIFEWNPADEKLPTEEFERVLISVNACKGRKARSATYFGNGKFHVDNGEFWKVGEDGLDAWMPLPDPYGGEENEQN